MITKENGTIHYRAENFEVSSNCGNYSALILPKPETVIKCSDPVPDGRKNGEYVFDYIAVELF